MVKVYIAYAGKNRNFSIISKETFEKMLPSLYGIPVVGEWKKEKEDFGTHGGKIEISDEGVEYIETTKPYGFIDSSSTVTWEEVTEDDGTVNEYLTATAFIWSGRYPEALKVLDNKTGQSMELNIFDGAFSEEHPEYFEIFDGEFSALCLLGEEIEPAFESAKVSRFELDKDEFKSEFTQMVAELKKSLNFTSEGGENVIEEKFEEVVEEIDEELKEDATEVTEDVLGEEDFEEKAAETECESFEDVEEEFDEEITGEPADEEIFEEAEEVVEEDYELRYNELLTIYTKLQEKFDLLEEEVISLRDFKTQKNKEEFEAQQEVIRQDKINHINTEYSNISEDIREMFVSKVDEYETKDDIDADICVYIVKNKVTFSKAKKKPESTKIVVEEIVSNPVASPYGDLF